MRSPIVVCTTATSKLSGPCSYNTHSSICLLMRCSRSIFNITLFISDHTTVFCFSVRTLSEKMDGCRNGCMCGWYVWYMMNGCMNYMTLASFCRPWSLTIRSLYLYIHECSSNKLMTDNEMIIIMLDGVQPYENN